MILFFIHYRPERENVGVYKKEWPFFFQVTGDYSDEEDPWTSRRRAGEEEDALEYFVLQESTGYMAPTLRCLAILHTIISFLCVVGYYYLKVQELLHKKPDMCMEEFPKIFSIFIRGE